MRYLAILPKACLGMSPLCLASTEAFPTTKTGHDHSNLTSKQINAPDRVRLKVPFT